MIRTEQILAQKKCYRRFVQLASSWIIVLQFPIPLLHIHGQECLLGGSLTDHVQRHHLEGDPQFGHWHWHFVMPWELADEAPDPEDSKRSLAFGACSELTVARPTIHMAFEVLCHAVPRALDDKTTSMSKLNELRHSKFCTGFMQSFINVPLCALICVLRC